MLIIAVVTPDTFEQARVKARSWKRGQWLGPDKRNRVVDTTIRAAQTEIILNNGELPVDYDGAYERAMTEIKTFGLGFLITAIAGFLVQKLLEWLWDEYFTEGR